MSGEKGSLDTFWYIVFVSQLPNGATEGILCGANLEPKEQDYAREDLDYAIYCRSVARSEEEARTQVSEWFADAGVNSPLEVVRANTAALVPTRTERKIAQELRCGDVLVKATPFAFKKGDDSARNAVLAFIREVFFKKRWQFWR